MITKMSHTSLFVKDQSAALAFYRDTLGFKVLNDVSMDNGFRWVTVQPPSQPDVEIVLIEPKPGPMFDAQSADAIRGLLEKGVMGAGVFDTDDCRATYETLKDKGVDFVSPPTDRFYGIEAVFKDGCGNWFSLTQRK